MNLLLKTLKDKMGLNGLVVSILMIFSFFVRVHNIGYPPDITWDEVYFVKFAQKMLLGEAYFNNHPPFGTLIIAFGILVFGDNPIGWRGMQVIAGVLLVPLSYLLGKKLFSHKYAGLLSAFFVSFESIYLTYSRIGLIDIFLIFFTVLSLLLFLHAIEKSSFKNPLFFILCGITSGLAIAVKWTGVVLFLIYFTWLVLAKKKVKVVSVLSLILIAAFTYISTFAFEKTNFEDMHKRYNAKTNNFIQSVISWHSLGLNAHTKKMSHPDSSKWYTWPFLHRPTWVHFKIIDDKNDLATCITTMGNPLVWWLGFIAILFQLFNISFKKDKSVIFLLVCYFLSLFPYMFIKRPMFIYHYMTALLFLILILEYTLVVLYQHAKQIRPALEILLILISVSFFYFYPFANATNVSNSAYNVRLHFKSWQFIRGKWRWTSYHLRHRRTARTKTMTK